MKNQELLLELVNLGLNACYEHIKNYYDGDSTLMERPIKTLELLRDEIKIRPKRINIRVLRGMRDLEAIAVRQFESTPLETAILDITDFLYEEYPKYGRLKILGSDYGKGTPI